MSDDIIKKLFGDFSSTPSAPPKPIQPKTTDRPDIKMFMLQILNSYGGLVDGDGMRWTKKYRRKENGKTYSITVELKEDAP